MRTRSQIRAAIGLLAATVLVGCGNDKNEAPTTPSTPVTPVTPSTPIIRGEPIGQPVAASIGIAGGTIALADGSVTIAVPVGAVSKNTTFTVTPIKNIAPSGVGTGIRLEPANLRFAVPVTVTFKYQQEATDTLDETGQSIAWQDSTGAWFSYINGTVTPAIAASRQLGAKGTVGSFRAGAGAVQAPVRRSGDLVRHYYWKPSPSTENVIELEVGEEKSLEVQTCPREQAGASRSQFGAPFDGGAEDDLAPLPKLCPPSTRVGTWSVFGVVGGTATSGTISSAFFLPRTSAAVYKAPDRVPPMNPVLVTGSLRWPERNVARPFVWKIRIVPKPIPLHVAVEFNFPSVQLYNSSFFNPASISDAVGFDIDVASDFTGTAFNITNDTTIVRSGGDPNKLIGTSFCFGPVGLGTFDFATLNSATVARLSQDSYTIVQFVLKTQRMQKGARSAIRGAGVCLPVEDTPPRTDDIELAYLVTPDQLPTKPGESRVVTADGAPTKVTLTYRK